MAARKYGASKTNVPLLAGFLLFSFMTGLVLVTAARTNTEDRSKAMFDGANGGVYVSPNVTVAPTAPPLQPGDLCNDINSAAADGCDNCPAGSRNGRCTQYNLIPGQTCSNEPGAENNCGGCPFDSEYNGSSQVCKRQVLEYGQTCTGSEAGVSGSCLNCPNGSFRGICNEANFFSSVANVIGTKVEEWKDVLLPAGGIGGSGAKCPEGQTPVRYGNEGDGFAVSCQ